MKKNLTTKKTLHEKKSHEKEYYITDNIKNLTLLCSIKYQNYRYYIGDIKINWNEPRNEETIKALLRGINLLLVKLMPNNTGLQLHKIDVTKKLKHLISKTN